MGVTIWYFKMIEGEQKNVTTDIIDKIFWPFKVFIIRVKLFKQAIIKKFGLSDLIHYNNGQSQNKLMCKQMLLQLF